jgi:predicted NAD/FAD-dependent oxidoreductase
LSAYLWRDGLVDQPLGETHLYSQELRVGLAGDWCIGGHAEDAFLSGQHLGRSIVASLGLPST